MSPVSRGRKPKQPNKRRKKGTPNSPDRSHGERAGTPGSTLTAIERLLGPPERPPWFDTSIKTVLDNADMVTSARGPRELEQLTAELLGAELHRAVHEERQGLWFAWWFAELADAATDRIKKEADGGSWEPPFWLLHGLAAMAPPALQPRLTPPSRARKWLTGEATAQLPAWLTDVPRIAATGELFRMRDAYGTRFAVIAGFSYPHARHRSVFLFDIDASGFVTWPTRESSMIRSRQPQHGGPTWATPTHVQNLSSTPTSCCAWSIAIPATSMSSVAASRGR